MPYAPTAELQGGCRGRGHLERDRPQGSAEGDAAVLRGGLDELGRRADPLAVETGGAVG